MKNALNNKNSLTFKKGFLMWNLIKLIKISSISISIINLTEIKNLKTFEWCSKKKIYEKKYMLIC